MIRSIHQLIYATSYGYIIVYSLSLKLLHTQDCTDFQSFRYQTQFPYISMFQNTEVYVSIICVFEIQSIWSSTTSSFIISFFMFSQIPTRARANYVRVLQPKLKMKMVVSTSPETLCIKRKIKKTMVILSQLKYHSNHIIKNMEFLRDLIIFDNNIKILKFWNFSLLMISYTTMENINNKN